jgi:hypothetical protein
MNIIVILILTSLMLSFIYKMYQTPFKGSPDKMRPLQDKWRIIANEANNLSLNIIDGPIKFRDQSVWLGHDRFDKLREQFRDNTGWLYGWQGEGAEANREWMNWGLIIAGEPCGKNAEMCPATIEILKSIPGIQVAGFSLMMPRSELIPHTDATGKTFGSMAYHLGLDCPGNCNMVIGDSKTRETNGKSFVFDATNTHWAENKSDKPRMILYVDYKI